MTVTFPCFEAVTSLSISMMGDEHIARLLRPLHGRVFTIRGLNVGQNTSVSQEIDLSL